MALETNEFFKSNSQSQEPRMIARRALVKTLAAQVGAVTEDNSPYPRCVPLAYDEGNLQWDLWRTSTLTNEEYDVTADATPATDGTFTLTVFGETTAAIDHDANAATIEAALVALGQLDVGDVSVTEAGGGLGSGGGSVTIEFTGAYAGTAVTLTADFTGLTGNTHVLSNGQDGSSTAPNGLGIVRGFLYVEKAVSESDEVQIVVMTEGEIHFDDIVLIDNSGSSGTNQGSTTQLRDALRNPNTRSPLLVVKGLDAAG